MTQALAILCYHRIVHADDAWAWPYLERGTAVQAATFARQLADLARFADLVNEDVALDVLDGRGRLRRASVWLTFDDGYRDVMWAQELVETATVFVTTGTVDRLLPADAWYRVLLAATRTRGHLDLGLGAFEFDLTAQEGRTRLIHGPERRAFLRADKATQDRTLEALARQLDATPTLVHPYLNEQELGTLVRRGWSLGSHGVSHTPFDSLDPAAVRLEAATSRDLLGSLGPVRSIALPDGAAVDAGLLRAVGYQCVLGLGDAVCATGLDVQPRFLVPDDPAWATRVLEPALRVVAYA